MNRQRTISLLVVLFVATILMLPTIAGAATSTRTLPASVEPGAGFTVSVSAADYGSIGSVVETIPAGFTYVSSSLLDSQVIEDGNTVTFNLMGDSSFDYTVTASNTEGTYTFSGILKNEDLVEFAITDSSIAVTAEPATPASAERTLPASVEPGVTVTVSMTAADYGAIGSVVETIPAGFTYVGSTLGAFQVTEDGNTVTFNLLGESSFDYTVTASDTEGTYTFSGIIINEDLTEFAITDSSIVVLPPVMDVPLHEGWDFISIPCVLENSSVDSVLAGVAYDGLLYYNAETGVWETGVSTFEVFKGYWINVSGSDQVILEDSLVKQEIQEPPEPRPEIPVYEGWNAVGSDYEFDETAEKTLVSIDDSYSKIVDEYDVIGFNGVNHEDADDGTKHYMMHPYEGYWVFVTQDGILG